MVTEPGAVVETNVIDTTNMDLLFTVCGKDQFKIALAMHFLLKVSEVFKISKG